jgi:hypothetical protein
VATLDKRLGGRDGIARIERGSEGVLRAAVPVPMRSRGLTQEVVHAGGGADVVDRAANTNELWFVAD